MTSNKELYLTTPVRRLFFKAALPGAVSMLSMTLFSLFDGMFVGQKLGDSAFAAVNLAIPFVIVNFALSDLIGVGSSVPISIHLGRGEEKEANNYFSAACLLIVLTGIFMGGLLYFSADHIMAFMGAEGELKRMAADYLKVYAICSPISTMTFAVDNFLKICGKIKTSMLLNVCNNILTLVLEFVFLFVLGLPVWAAALAACIAMMTCSITAITPFLLKKLPLKLRVPRISFGLIRHIVSSGSPTFFSNVAGRITSILMNMALLRLGGPEAVTIFGVIMYGGDIVQPLLYGICDSMQPAIGYNYGARLYTRVKKIEKHVMVATATVSAIAIAVMMIIPEAIASIFLQPDETELLSRSADAMRVFCLTFATRWFGFSVQSFLTALDKPLPATVLSLSSAFVYPVILLGALWTLGLDGLWLNTPIAAALVAVTAGITLILLGKSLFNQREHNTEDA